MNISRDRISGLVFLALSLAYYFLARNIELYPGEEEELINAQTFPRFIGLAGAFIAFLIIVVPAKEADTPTDWRAYDWGRPLLLCVVMVLYGLTIKTVGFFLSTSVFLIIGFLILGERRWWALLAASVPIAAGFQGVLHGLLDIYIEDPFLVWLGITS